MAQDRKDGHRRHQGEGGRKDRRRSAKGGSKENAITAARSRNRGSARSRDQTVPQARLAAAAPKVVSRIHSQGVFVISARESEIRANRAWRRHAAPRLRGQKKARRRSRSTTREESES